MISIVKIIIDARAFIRIMVNAEVGSGRLLVYRGNCSVMWNDIYPSLPAKGKTFEKVYQIFLKSGDGRLIKSLFFLENELKTGNFLPIFRGWAFIRIWASIRVFTVYNIFKSSSHF